MKYDPAGYWEFRYKGEFYYGGTLYEVLAYGVADVFASAGSTLPMMALELMSLGQMGQGKDDENWSIRYEESK
jgi:hypothetical protein